MVRTNFAVASRDSNIHARAATHLARLPFSWYYDPVPYNRAKSINLAQGHIGWLLRQSQRTSVMVQWVLSYVNVNGLVSEMTHSSCLDKTIHDLINHIEIS